MTETVVPRVEWRTRPAELPPTLDEATTALREAEGALSRWVGEEHGCGTAADAAAADLAEAEARAGADVYADPQSIEAVTEALAKLRLRQDVARRAVQAAADRVDAARRAVLTARAAELTARAARLREVVTARQAKTDQMIAGLNEHERSSFGWLSPSLMITGTAGPRPLSLQLAGRADWLAGRADELRRVAATGAPDEVVSAVAQGVLPAIAIEAEALGLPSGDTAEPASAAS